MSVVALQEQPTIGLVSLGCPKALVDSERILTRLRSEGYRVSTACEGADAVIVNTCGFLDSAKEQSLEAIGEAIAANGCVIVTGCMGVEAERIRTAFPEVHAISGPQQYEAVVRAVREAVPRAHHPFVDLVPEPSVRLTPRHYAYLKISEGCNHACSFCIIPSLRGKLVSRPANRVLHEAERLVAAGVKELLIISQDTSAYGADLKHAASEWRGTAVPARLDALCAALGELGVWVRLHYVYPYPSVDRLIPLMAERRILPYLDIPFQHASASVLKAMRRPASQARTLERIQAWRTVCPDLALRSTFVVGFPGETEQDFELLLEWLAQTRLDRVGCFRYENVEGARANALPDHVSEDVKDERWHRLMARQQEISAEKLNCRVGREMEVLVDEVDGDRAICRSYADAPEIDGTVVVDDVAADSGDLLRVRITAAGHYDLEGEVIAGGDRSTR